MGGIEGILPMHRCEVNGVGSLWEVSFTLKEF